MYEYDEDEEGGRSRGRMIATVVAVVALAVVGWFVVNSQRGGGDDADGGGDGGSVIPGDATSTTTAAGDGSVAPSVDAPSTTDDAATSDPTVKADKPATSEATATTSRESTTAPTTAAPTTVAGNAPYATLPDGSPQWVVATYNTNSITLDGVVPDQAAKETLEALAVRNAKDGQAETVTNNLTLNPAVPRNVGVRVVELTSTRFPEGSAEVLPPHAAELDRIVNVMNLLPNITALVIGHADQRGDDLANYALSEERALAVKNYVASQGIAFDRLQSRAVGETDLLTLDDDDAALALNRRTEFVLFGLLNL